MAYTNEQKHDNDAAKGAVEQDKPKQRSQESMAGQLDHRDQDPLIKGQDSDFPEPGQNPEHSGGKSEKKIVNPEYSDPESEPGFAQRENQNKEKDDPLAG